MGLDAIELLLRAEELFAVAISDEEAASIRTVGDLYQLVCSKLDVTPLRSPTTPAQLPRITDKQSILLFLERRPLPAPAETQPWLPESVGACTVALFVDQLTMKPAEVVPDARIADDLRVD